MLAKDPISARPSSMPTFRQALALDSISTCTKYMEQRTRILAFVAQYQSSGIITEAENVVKLYLAFMRDCGATGRSAVSECGWRLASVIGG